MSYYEHEHFDLVRSIYASCALSSFWLGILLNIFLGWLILKKTPAPMQIYNKLLLAPCLMCILIAISTFLVQPIPIVDHGFHAVIQNGPIRDLPQPWNYTANVLWFQMLLLFVCCTTVQFSFRYYMLSRDGQIPLKWKYLTGFLVYLLLVAHVALHYWSDYPSEDQMPSMIQLAKQVHLELGITDIHFSSFTWARSFPWLLHCFAMIAIFAVCYWIILFCALKTSRFIEKLYGNNLPECKNTKKGKRAKIGEIGKNKKNEKIRQYHSQVTMAFIIQAILPTIEVVELTIQTTLPAFFPTNQTVHYMVYAAIPLYFIPVLNPLATMLLVKPYQMAVLKMLGLGIGQRKVITTVIHEGRMIRNSLIGHQQPIIISPHAVEPMFSIA